jgi:hypothetical protein
MGGIGSDEALDKGDSFVPGDRHIRTLALSVVLRVSEPLGVRHLVDNTCAVLAQPVHTLPSSAREGRSH